MEYANQIEKLKYSTDNIVLATDSYKLNHWNQYLEGTQGVYSYFESREGAEFPYTVFFGLQAILKRYLVGDVVKETDIDIAAKIAKAHFGDNGFLKSARWDHIMWDHKGKLPLRIKAVPEGTKVPTGNVLMTVENTCDECYWLTNAMESLLVHTWYPSTVATLSTHTIEMIGGYLDKTGCTRDGLGFMLHDFGYRGASSHESAALGGAAHLLSSRGTDTLPGMLAALEYYDANLDDLAFSVPATEHSIMTARGEDGEMDLLGELLENYPSGILSVVSDSYNVMNFVRSAVEHYGDQIMARDGKLVFRPDSLRNDDDTPEKQMVGLSNLLYSSFGGTINEAGYKELDPRVGLLWGDGIDPDGIERILDFCYEEGFAASNYVFGMGGGLLQKVNRDTQRFAFKCSAQKHNDEWVSVKKNPLDQTKRSKAGRLMLLKDEHGDYKTEATNTPNLGELVTVFEDGELVKEYTFDEVRANLAG